MKILLVVCVVIFAVCGQLGTGQTVRPNILFILADDLGWSDIGYNNPYVITPTLDGLAENGVILNQSYVQSTCTPSRASLMTGYFAYRTGLQHGVLIKNQPSGLPLHFTTLPQKLKEQGYSTYMLGKWHLGFCKYEYTPNGRGFDHFYGFYTAGGDYFNHTTGPKKYLDLREDLTPDWTKTGQYSSEVFAEKAAEYVANHDQSNPLFMYFSLQSVHGPLQVPERYLDKYLFVKTMGRRIKLGMVTAMDDAVKVVVDAFKEHGLWENTLLVFLSDNGGPANENNYGCNWPLRGSKKTLWEGGTRAVNFVHGSMLEKTGYVNDGMVHVADWFPTLVNLAGGETDPDMDGVNVWDAISKGDPSPRTEFVYNIDEVDEIPSQAIRVGDYKLIHGRAGNPGDWFPPPENYCYEETENGRLFGHYTRLYNIKEDPTEHSDLSDEMPEKVEELKAKLEEFKLKGVPAISPPTLLKESSPSRFGGVYSPGWC